MATEYASRRGHEAANGVTIHLEGEYDLAEAPVLARRLLEAVKAYSRVEIDMSAVTFFGARALAALALAQGYAQRRRSALVVTKAAPIVQRLLEISGLPGLLQDVDELVVVPAGA